MTIQLNGNLLFEAFVIGLLCFWMLKAYLDLRVALFITFVRIMIPLFYFGFFFDGHWNFLDDITYLRSGAYILDRGYNPLTALITTGGQKVLLQVTGGGTFLYYWWNALAQYLFGRFYFAPVFLNIFVTCVTGVFLYRIVRFVGASVVYAQGFLVFFLLHWDLVAWTSLINLKDPIVMMLNVATLYFASVFLETRHILYGLACFGCVVLYLLIRFYQPIIWLACIGVWFLFYSKGKQKYLVMILGVIVALYVGHKIGGTKEIIYYMKKFLVFSAGSLIPGLFRFLLTPRPWGIDEGSSFLLLPAIFNWFFFIFTLFGALLLWKKRSKEVNLMLLFFLAVCLLFAAFAGQQGPRHRFQLTFGIAWMQYHCLWIFLKSLYSGNKMSPSNEKALFSPP
ncbi:hypothetical protein WDW89_02300 [Deltaproteobacteria bacterium TL4]